MSAAEAERRAGVGLSEALAELDARAIGVDYNICTRPVRWGQYRNVRGGECTTLIMMHRWPD